MRWFDIVGINDAFQNFGVCETSYDYLFRMDAPLSRGPRVAKTGPLNMLDAFRDSRPNLVEKENS